MVTITNDAYITAQSVCKLLALAGLFGLHGETWQGNVLESAMPAAVATTLVATVYKLKPSLVTAIVFLGTALSPLTLTPLLVYLAR